jgi:hypothetical protein
MDEKDRKVSLPFTYGDPDALDVHVMSLEILRYGCCSTFRTSYLIHIHKLHQNEAHILVRSSGLSKLHGPGAQKPSERSAGNSQSSLSR